LVTVPNLEKPNPRKKMANAKYKSDKRLSI